MTDKRHGISLGDSIRSAELHPQLIMREAHGYSTLGSSAGILAQPFSFQLGVVCQHCFLTEPFGEEVLSTELELHWLVG